MYSACGSAALPALGFPIRASADHGLFSASPRLIAATHVLHRLLVPRHPPCALPILTVIDLPKEAGDTQFVWPTVQFSRSDEARAAGTPRRGLSKLNSVGACGTRPGPVDIPRTAGALKRLAGSKRKSSLERR